MFIEFTERGRERETLICERNIIGCFPYTPQHGGGVGNGTHKVGMGPDSLWKPQPFGVQGDAPTN